MKTTFSRTFFTAAVILMVAFTLLGTAFQMFIQNYLTDTTISNLSADAHALAELASAYSYEGDLNNSRFRINLNIAARVSDVDAVVCDDTGRVVLCSDMENGCNHVGMQVNRDFLEKVYTENGDISEGLIRGLYQDNRYIVSVPVKGPTGEPIGMVILSTPTQTTANIIHRISNMYMMATVVVVLVAVLAVSLFARKQSQPLKDMSRAAYHFGHGRLDARVPISENYSEEVEELAVAFNNMASLLQKSEYQRQEFVANVSHELKTPMTTISGYIDGILDGTIPPERQKKYLQIVSDETKRLSRLVRSMLDISRLQDQGGVPEEQKIHFDLTEAVGQVLITFEQKINEKSLDVQVDMPMHPVYTRANKDAITQVIYNLLDNAVKFSPEKGVLGIRVRESGRKVYISVSNQGQTIPAEELPLVFDRFHKMDKSRTQNRDGWGLGLYIVKTIVCSHGENIGVTSRDGTTEFTFTMPMVN